jgi:hypothetical protein
VKRSTPGLLLRPLSFGPCRSKLTEKTLLAESPCIVAKYCTGSPAALLKNNLTVPAVTGRAVLNFIVKVIWAADFTMMLAGDTESCPVRSLGTATSKKISETGP